MFSNIPVSFKYDGNVIRGFEDLHFKLSTREEKVDNNVKYSAYTYDFKDDIKVTVLTESYDKYNAFTQTVWFENTGTSNTRNISELKCADMILEGKNPVLKGILGDHVNQYRPYEIDLSERNTEFSAVTGRATHVNFPYFLLEADECSYLIALGWAGTWKAVFNSTEEGVHLAAKGVINLDTYLKPGEKIRTPLMCIITCDANRDKSIAMNHWRKWFVNHVMPRNGAKETEPVRPMITNCLALDTGRPNSDGSISEYYGSWKPSLDKYYQESLEMDIRWVDAGWYCDPYNKSVPADWWGTVGTWTLDREKWPGDSIRQSVEYAEKHGAYTMMWFEPERVTHVEALSQNYGFNPEWVLTDGGPVKLANLAREDCVSWLTERIISTMDEHGIHMYREDFNCDPAPYWSIGDQMEDGERTGITENLYVQGHYRLWDNIIDYCRKTNKLPFIDSCASGGGRNDLESMRRAIPMLRSDSDRTSAALRLSMTTSFMEWIPCCGASTKESVDQLEAGKPDLYVLRASYLPILNYGFEYTQDRTLNFDLLRQGQKEWKMIKPFFYGDFYVLTPWHPESETDKWTVYMFIKDNKGIIQAFRQETCEQDSIVVKLKGLDENRYYSIHDIDGRNIIYNKRGNELAEGLTIKLPEKRTAAILLINS